MGEASRAVAPGRKRQVVSWLPSINDDYYFKRFPYVWVTVWNGRRLGGGLVLGLSCKWLRRGVFVAHDEPGFSIGLSGFMSSKKTESYPVYIQFLGPGGLVKLKWGSAFSTKKEKTDD